MGNCLCPADPAATQKDRLEEELRDVRAQHAAIEEGVPEPSPVETAAAGAEAKVKAQAEEEAKAQEKAAEVAAKAAAEAAALEEAALEAKHKAEEAARALEATIEQPKQIKAHLQKAKEKFDELDADDSGALESGEIEKLAQWVFGQFHPDEQMSPQQQDSQMAKLMELDVNHDGKIDFGEFGDWFNETAKSIYQYQHEQGWLAREKQKEQQREEMAAATQRKAEEAAAAEQARAAEAAATAEAEAKAASEEAAAAAIMRRNSTKPEHNSGNVARKRMISQSKMEAARGSFRDDPGAEPAAEPEAEAVDAVPSKAATPALPER